MFDTVAHKIKANNKIEIDYYIVIMNKILVIDNHGNAKQYDNEILMTNTFSCSNISLKRKKYK